MTDLDRRIARIARILRRATRGQQCGGRTRNGTPCRMRPATPFNRRCRLHGGLSTGPTTAEGKARIAEAQRQRWARWRGLRKTDQEDHD